MSKTTPLFEQHKNAGAKIVDFGGWQMPLHYGSQIQEHHDKKLDKDDGYIPLEEAEQIKKENAEIGIIGEWYAYLKLNQKYKQKYQQVVEPVDEQPENGFMLTGEYAANPKDKSGKIAIEVIWNNRSAYEAWGKKCLTHPETKFEDPGNKHYDLLITKTYPDSIEKNKKIRYLEVKSTGWDNSNLLSLSQKECELVLKEKKTYRLLRVSNLFTTKPRIKKYKDVHHLFDDPSKPIHEITLRATFKQ